MRQPHQRNKLSTSTRTAQTSNSRSKALKYDFRLLSPYDFQLLARDLLGAAEGRTYESFAAGKDGGVDLRWRGATNIVVQCKHYVASGHGKLKAKMASEVPSWSEANHQKRMCVHPLSKYALVTSVALTPHRKAELEEILTKSGAPEVEVLGQEDLNRLLAQHPTIEQRHPSLWLTSVPALQRVLNSAFFGQSDVMKDRAKRRLQVFVMNPSYDLARKMLETNRVCVLAGEQGVGKTCLAEVLVSTYIDQGYEAYEVTGDIADVYRTLDTNRPQVFLYDDFLGMTALEEKLNKNEESRLVSLVEAVKKSSSSRLILTTREYILRQAKFTYEKLDRAQLDLLKFVVEVSHLNRRARADILYRHLCFSTVPAKAINEFVQSRTFLKVVDHPNYNPRLIEIMCETSPHVRSKPTDFPRRFLAALDNPQTVWQHPFERHLDQGARDLVLTVCSFPRNVLLGDLLEAVSAFSKGDPNVSVGRRDRLLAEEQLRVIEGTFIALSATSKKPVAGVMKPSLRDFVEAWFDGRDAECENLLSSVVRFEQIEWAVQQALSKTDGGFCRAIARNPSALREALLRTFFTQNCTTNPTYRGDSVIRQCTISMRLGTVLRGTTLLPKSDASYVFTTVLRDAESRGFPSGESVREVLGLAQQAMAFGVSGPTNPIGFVKRHFEELVEASDDPEEVAMLLEVADDGEIGEGHAELTDILKSRFRELADDLSRDTLRYSTSDEWRDELDRIEALGADLRVNVSDAVSRISDRIAELDEDEQNLAPIYYSPDRGDASSEEVSDNELVMMFASLICD